MNILYSIHLSLKEVLISIATMLLLVLYLPPTVSFLRHVRAFVQDFREHPQYRGPNFDWWCVITLAWYNWRACYMSPWERWKYRRNG